MVRATNIETSKKIFGMDFIGPSELSSISKQMNLSSKLHNRKTIMIPFEEIYLKKIAKDYILIFGQSKNKNREKLTLSNMRGFFGLNPEKKEPCFYNQDWYLKEGFANKTTLENKWYLIRKNVINKTRGKRPEEILKNLPKDQIFPSAILTAYTFFAYYFLNKKILWKNDFIWCSDKDHNGDIIYTGRYEDPTGINKKGFNIHRHLSIRSIYGLAPQVIKD